MAKRARNASQRRKSIRREAELYRLRSGAWLNQAPRGHIDLALEEYSQATQGRVPPTQMLTPDTLRYMAERSKIFSSILSRRYRQVSEFARRPLFDGDTGFEVVPRDMTHSMTDAEREEARRLEDLLLQTGTVYNPNRQDNLRTALLKMVYNTLVYDALVIEPVVDEDYQLVEWIVLDGGSVQRANPDKYEPITEAGKRSAPIHYVQTVNNRPVAEWSADELIYLIRNPSPALDRFGYGQPELEVLVDVITIEIEVLTWAKMVLGNSSIPDGLMILKAASDTGGAPAIAPFGSQQTAEDLVREWRNSVSGARNAGRMAIFQIGPSDNAEFHETATKNRDMPFRELFELIQNIICAHLGISPAELGIVEGSLKQASMIDNAGKSSDIRQSRQDGLVYLLGILGEALDRILARVNPEYTIMWRGIDIAAEERRHNLEAAMLDSGRLTYDDVRKMGNRKPYGKWWAQIPNNPLVLQIEAAERGIQLHAGGGAAGGSQATPSGRKPAIKGTPESPSSARPGSAPTATKPGAAKSTPKPKGE